MGVALANARKKFGAKTNVEAIKAAAALGLLAADVPASARCPFTEREQAILLRLAQHFSHREIGEDLGISKTNVSGRIRYMRAKVRARSTEDLLDVASDLGLLGSRPRRRVHRRRLESVQQRPPIRALPPRAQEVCQALCRWQNDTHAQIAQRLGVSKACIDQYSCEIKRLYGVRTRAELAKRAARERERQTQESSCKNYQE